MTYLSNMSYISEDPNHHRPQCFNRHNFADFVIIDISTSCNRQFCVLPDSAGP